MKKDEVILDIYFSREYGKMCEYMEGGINDVFVLHTKYGTIQNQFIKREVPYVVSGEKYYDIMTPYGYGGPIILEATNREILVRQYEEQFSRYCAEHRIVCEFIRYHPIFRNYEDFGFVYENEYSRHTVGTNLTDYDDPFQSEFSKSARKEVRRAEKAGLTCSLHLHPERLDVFRKLYEETMDRNHADIKYYFPDEYYNNLTNQLRGSVLEIQAEFKGETIASELYFIKGDIMHAHLLGSSNRLIEIGGGAILEASAVKWGKKNGYRYIHHGGGRSPAEDDALYLYKKKFGKNTLFDFYVGKKIWNHDVYNQLVKCRKEEGKTEDPSFFPAYRG